ncbi:MAG: TetR/AcrR family transcriptional regulator [Aquisalimonadaceae bacterium]
MDRKRSVGRPRGEHTEDVRGNILEAAREQFLAMGFDRSSLRDIAAQAGVSKGMIAYYFGTKERLYEAALIDVLAPLLDDLRHLQAGAVSDVSGEIFRLYYRLFARFPDLAALMLSTLMDRNNPFREFLLDNYIRPGFSHLLQLSDVRSGSEEEHALKERLVSLFSLAVTPVALRPVFEDAIGVGMDQAFYERLAEQHASLLPIATQHRSNG